MNNQRIWKTGVVAVAATVAFAIFAFKAEDWTGALRSQFVALGQAGGTGTSGGTSSTGTTGGGSTITKIIPQIAVGSFDGGLTKYSTIIQITNSGSAAVSVSGNLYKEEPGNAASSSYPLAFLTSATGTPSFTGTLPSLTIQPNTSLVLTGTSNASGSVGWAKLVSTGSISVSSVFELRDSATGILYSRVGVAPSAADMKKFVIQRLRNVAAGLDVGFALVNTGSTSATITATLYDVSGAQIGAQNITLAGGGHTAKFAAQLFNLTSEPAGTTYSYMLLSSGSSQWAAMALAFEGAGSTSFAVDRLE